MRKQYHHGDLKNTLIRAGAEILAQRGGGRPHAPLGGPARRRQPLRPLRPLRRQAGARGRHLHRGAAAGSGRASRWPPPATPATRCGGSRRPPGRPCASGSSSPTTTGWSSPTPSSGSGRLPGLGGADAAELRRAGRLVRGLPGRRGARRRGRRTSLAVELWSLVHGLASLLTSRQVPRRLAARLSPRALLRHALGALVRGSVSPPRRQRRDLPRRDPQEAPEQRRRHRHQPDHEAPPDPDHAEPEAEDEEEERRRRPAASGRPGWRRR